MSRNAISANPEHYIFKISQGSMLPDPPRRPKKFLLAAAWLKNFFQDRLPPKQKILDRTLTDIFSDVFIRPLHGTLGFIKSYLSGIVKFIEHPQCFTFRIILWFYAILRVLALYSYHGYSISNEKLNGRQIFESLGLLGALTFLFKQHISL